MSKCEQCGKEIRGMPFKCPYCHGYFCEDHRLPENHDCFEKMWLIPRQKKHLFESKIKSAERRCGKLSAHSYVLALKKYYPLFWETTNSIALIALSVLLLLTDLSAIILMQAPNIKMKHPQSLEYMKNLIAIMFFAIGIMGLFLVFGLFRGSNKAKSVEYTLLKIRSSILVSILAIYFFFLFIAFHHLVQMQMPASFSLLLIGVSSVFIDIVLPHLNPLTIFIGCIVCLVGFYCITNARRISIALGIGIITLLALLIFFIIIVLFLGPFLALLLGFFGSFNHICYSGFYCDNSRHSFVGNYFIRHIIFLYCDMAGFSCRFYNRFWTTLSHFLCAYTYAFFNCQHNFNKAYEDRQKF